MKLEKNCSGLETFDEINFYLENILTVNNILKIANQDENDIDLGSNI